MRAFESVLTVSILAAAGFFPASNVIQAQQTFAAGGAPSSAYAASVQALAINSRSACRESRSPCLSLAAAFIVSPHYTAYGWLSCIL